MNSEASIKRANEGSKESGDPASEGSPLDKGKTLKTVPIGGDPAGEGSLDEGRTLQIVPIDGDPAASEGSNESHKTGAIGRVASLAQYLPSTTVFAFQTLAPSFTHSGKCLIANKYLTSCLIIACAIICFLFSFTDTIRHPKTGKLYFGIATINGLYIMNKNPKDVDEAILSRLNLSQFKMRAMDWIHAIVTLSVFMAFAISDTNVDRCLLPEGENSRELFLNLPLALASFASLIFFIFPNTRRGISTATEIKKGKNGHPDQFPKNNTTSLKDNFDDKGSKPPPGKEDSSSRKGNIGRVKSLAQLLPSNTVFVFQTLAPSFTNTGTCCTANKYLTSSLIIVCAIVCFLFSFTDTIKDPETGKLYFGIATLHGFYVMNKNPKEEDDIEFSLDLEEYRMRAIDWIHAIVSFAVFMAFAISNANVVMCLLPKRGENLRQLFINFPLGLTSFASLIFFVFPTSRRLIGSSEEDKVDKKTTAEEEAGKKAAKEDAGKKTATAAEKGK